MSTRRSAVVLTAVVALVAGACGGGDDSGSAGGDARAIEVRAFDFGFDPEVLELEPGEEVEVTLVNDGEAPHTFTVDDLDVDVEAEAGESASVTFTAPEEGAVEFHCHFHEDEMVGEITVDGSAAEDSGGHDGGHEEEEEDSGGKY